MWFVKFVALMLSAVALTALVCWLMRPDEEPPCNDGWPGAY